MLKDNKHIDGLFADGLKNLSVPPSPKVWEGVSGQMLAAKKRRLFAIYMWTGVAASILLLLAIGNRYLTDQPTYNMQLETLTENTIYPEGTNKANTNTKQVEELNGTGVKIENNISNGNNTNEKRLADASKVDERIAASNGIELQGGNSDRFLPQSKVLNAKAISANSDGSTFEGMLAENSKNDDLSFLDNDFVSLLTNSEESLVLANVNFKLPTQLQPNTSQFKQEQSFSFLADEIQIQKNLLAIEQLKQKEIKENRWSVIGQVSSSFSSYSGDSKGSNAEKGIWSVGGGAKVNYAMNEKIAFQTGIVYNRFGQDMSSGRRGDLFYSDASNSVGGEFTERVAVYPSQTSAGVIKLSSGEVAKNSEMNEYASSYVSSDYLIQSFKAIEIPLLMRYSLIQKRVGMFVSGGLSANLIVGNGVYDQSEGNKKIGEIDGIRTTNFSSQFSFGLEYRLSEKLQIGLEPSMKYYLNSINKSSQYQYKPYSIGIFTGIRYDF